MPTKRIKLILKNPNPLFKKWLEELLTEAENRNSKLKYNIKCALESLNRFPLPLASGKDCAILHGFGPKLCKMIDKRLENYKFENKEKLNNSVYFYEKNIKAIVKNINHKKKNPGTSKDCLDSKTTAIISVKPPNKGCQQIIMSPGEFKIFLIIDSHETKGKSKNYLNELKRTMDKERILYEVRTLNVGDFCWIAQDTKGNELVLPYITERKRMDDLSKSIRDGRFHEQKFRLRESGIENLIYLIENYKDRSALPLTTLMQASVNTKVHSEFKIKFTDGTRDSIMYLITMTKILDRLFKDKVLVATTKAQLTHKNFEMNFLGLMKFDEFNESSLKTKASEVREIFTKQLLQLKNLSIDKAIAITSEYPTPKSLLLAYKSCLSVEERENLLANIKYGKLKRPIGAAISKILYEFYNTYFDRN